MKAEPEPPGLAPYKSFGWQGITLTVPSRWELVYTRGDYAAGHVRLADERAVRLEVRWQAGPAQAPASDTVESYLRGLRKKLKGSGFELSVQRNLKLASPPGKKVECYGWSADRQALGMLSRCQECGRTVHMHLLGEPQERLRGLARTVFSSLRDHPEGEELQWRFFDLDFRSPRRLPLRSSSLQAGCIRMQFGAGRTKLELVRLSLAEVLLRRRGLEEWFRSFYGPSLKRRSYRIVPDSFRGHQALALSGRAWLVVNPLAVAGRRRVVRAACWHCERTNRLFICGFDGPEAEQETFERARDGLRCCDAAR